MNPATPPPGPAPVELEAGTHFLCTCGKTGHPPFCDGSHKGSGRQPLRLEVAERRTVRICQCGRSGTPPLCDGSHNRPPAQ